jgi:hypothetical protein
LPSRDSREKVTPRLTLSCATAAIHHKSVGLRGGHRDLFMIDALRNICPVRMTGDEAESSKAQKRSGEFNRAE